MTFHYTAAGAPETKMLVEFLADRARMDHPPDPDKVAALAVVDKDRLLGACIYSNWFPAYGVIELSMAALSPKWMSRKTMAAILDYPFGQLGCQMVVARCGESNEAVKRICRRLECNEVFIPRLRGPNEGEHVFTLTAEQWAESKYRRPH